MVTKDGGKIEGRCTRRIEKLIFLSLSQTITVSWKIGNQYQLAGGSF
jgi:hypothetical protein